MDRFNIVKHRSIEYLSLNKILEDMASVRQFRVVSRPRFFRLADYLESAYVRESRRHAELGRRCTDTSRHDQHHVLSLVSVMPVDLAYKPCDGMLVVVRHVVVSDRIDIHDDVEFIRL